MGRLKRIYTNRGVHSEKRGVRASFGVNTCTSLLGLYEGFSRRQQVMLGQLGLGLRRRRDWYSEAFQRT